MDTHTLIDHSICDAMSSSTPVASVKDMPRHCGTFCVGGVETGMKLCVSTLNVK